MKKICSLLLVAMFLVGCGTVTDSDVVESNINTESTNDTEEKNLSTQEHDENSSEVEELSVIYNAYADYLETMEISELLGPEAESLGYGQLVYTFEYFDHDLIPELIFGSTDCIHASNIYILKYVDGEVRRFGPYGENNGFTFFEGTSMFVSSWYGGGIDESIIYKLNDDGTTEKLLGFTGELDDDGNVISSKYMIGENVVSEDEYFRFRDSHLENHNTIYWDCFENENGYDEITSDNIQKIRQMK